MKTIKERHAEIKRLLKLHNEAPTYEEKLKITQRLFRAYDEEKSKPKTVDDQFNEMFRGGK